MYGTGIVNGCVLLYTSIRMISIDKKISSMKNK